jgi:hypothetical protein
MNRPNRALSPPALPGQPRSLNSQRGRLKRERKVDTEGAVRALLRTEFAALPVLTRANLSQVAFARITGYTPRQVNDWPAVAPQHHSGRSLSPRSCRRSR